MKRNLFGDVTDNFDPYDWVFVRSRGFGVFMVDYGLIPAVVASISFAALLLVFGSELSPFITAPLFSLVAAPVYLWQSYQNWEENENAFAEWVAHYGRHLLAERGSL